MRLHPTRSALINIDSNGTTRLGPLPLRNTNLRDAAFTVVGHLKSSNVSVSAADSAMFSSVVETVAAMNRAGITSIALRVDPAPAADQSKFTNK
jgi:biopolymer transport protein ExbD